MRKKNKSLNFSEFRKAGWEGASKSPSLATCRGAPRSARGRQPAGSGAWAWPDPALGVSLFPHASGFGLVCFRWEVWCEPEILYRDRKKKKKRKERRHQPRQGDFMLSLPPCAFTELLDFLLLLLLPEMGQRNELGCPLLPTSIPASPVPAKPELREHQVATSSPSPAPAFPKGRKVVRASPSPSWLRGSWDSRARGRGAQRDTTWETSSLAGVLSLPPFPWLFSSLGGPFTLLSVSCWNATSVLLALLPPFLRQPLLCVPCSWGTEKVSCLNRIFQATLMVLLFIRHSLYLYTRIYLFPDLSWVSHSSCFCVTWALSPGAWV